MKLPHLSPAQMRHALQCATTCDAALTDSDKEWLRAYWFKENWAEGVTMAKYDNGGGDHMFVFFTHDGKAIIKGFDHESEVSPHAQEEYATWPGLYEGAPPELFALLEDEAVEHEDATFCCWSSDGQTWQHGSAEIPAEMDDGSDWMLPMLQMDAEEFTDWARGYYEEKFATLGEDGVKKIYGAA